MFKPVELLALRAFLFPHTIVKSKSKSKSKITPNRKRVIKENRESRARTKELEARLVNNPAGRPTEFKAEYCEQAYRLTLLGMTLEEMAKVFGVGFTTVQEWKRDVPEFSAAIRRAGPEADGMVTNSLFKRATGHAGEKVFYDARAGEIVRAGITHLPSEVAAIFWLKNRQPHLWRDRHDFTSSDGSFSAFAVAAIEEGKSLEDNLRKENANGHAKD